MMGVAQCDIDTGVEILKRHGATRIILFGSTLDRPAEARDIDFAVEGIPPTRFLASVGDLLDHLPVLADLVDLSDDNPLTRYIRKKGRVVYERQPAVRARSLSSCLLVSGVPYKKMAPIQ